VNLSSVSLNFSLTFFFWVHTGQSLSGLSSLADSHLQPFATPSSNCAILLQFTLLMSCSFFTPTLCPLALSRVSTPVAEPSGCSLGHISQG
jgi:hypothetical protein